MARRANNGADNGKDSGRDTGDEHRSGLDMDEFCALVSPHMAGLKPDALVTRLAADRMGSGARLGTVPLSPIESLEDRVSSLYPGVHTLRVNARGTDGRWFASGEMELANGVAGGAPGTDGGLVAQLLKQNEALSAKVEALLRGPPQADPVEQLTKFANLVKSMQPAPAPAPPAPPSAAEQLLSLTATLEAVEKLAGRFGGNGADREPLRILAEAAAPGVKTLVEGAGAMLVARVAERHEAYEERQKKPEPSGQATA